MSIDSLHQDAGCWITRHKNAFRYQAIASVQPKPSLPRGTVRTMASNTIVCQYRPDVFVEADTLYSSV
jgi:hypothetical protein